MKRIKNICFLLILSLSLAASGKIAFASSKAPETVRIGLSSSYADKESISVKNSSVYIGTNAEKSFNSGGELYSYSGFDIRMPSGYYVDLNESFDTYDEAYINIYRYDNYGYDICPVLKSGNYWTIYICGIYDSSEASSIASKEGGYIVSSSSVIEICSGGEVIAAADGISPQLIPADSDYISLGSKSYRGTVEFVRNNGGNITAVNIVSLDEYLYSVVPSEMPSTWHSEALKAQIIAARSYTVSRLSAHTGSGYNLCDSSHCQIYGGVNSEKSNVTALVDKTSGIMALYNGEPINAVYCSSSGGHTDNSENVWSAAVEYLRGVKEIFGTTGTSWSRTYSSDDMSALCIANGTDVGSVTSIDITCSNLTGRVQKMTIKGTKGNITLTKEDIRNFFSSNGGSLPSRMFTLNGLGVTDYSGAVYTSSESAYDDVIIVTAISSDITPVFNSDGTFTLGGQKFAFEGMYNPSSTSVSASAGSDTLSTFTASGSSYNFSGSGSGHGIGLSQYGAKEMAENGYTYISILKHYYTGITIE